MRKHAVLRGLWADPRRRPQSSVAHAPRGARDLDAAPTLCLNADYTPLSQSPLSLLNWKDALRVVYSGKANVVSVYEGLVLRSTGTYRLSLPSVIALKQFHDVPARRPVLTRRNVFLRDNFKCCYCNECFTSNELTLDHVVPKSKGGGSVWLNLVTSCIECNQRKGDKTLRELRPLGMRLHRQPRVPSTQDLQVKRQSDVYLHPHWRDFCFDV